MTSESDTLLSRTQKSNRSASPVPNSYLNNSHLANSSPHLTLPHSRRSSLSSTGSADPIDLPIPTLRTQRSQPQLSRPTLQTKDSKGRLRRQKSGEDTTSWTKQKPALDTVTAKRNAEFHALFRSVPEKDSLIEDYGCALQKEILLQGRIYFSENHICFNANIFGWVTNLVIAFADVIDIEKRATAIFIPNAILISTSTAKYFFASFLSREQAYDQMVDLWHMKQSNLEINDYSAITTEDISDTDESSGSYESEDEQRPRMEGLPTLPTPQPVNNNTSPQLETECECGKKGEHYPTTVLDQIYPGSIESIYNLLYNSTFLKQFLTDVEKSTDVTIGAWAKGEGAGKCVRSISYVKYLGASIGPKTTKCNLKEEIQHLDLESYVTQLTITQTPDVPAGSSFFVNTRTCISSAGQGKVRVLVTVLIDFVKSSWLRSTIEKACIEGQTNYYRSLDTFIRQQIGTTKSDKKKKRSHRPHHHTEHESLKSISTTSTDNGGIINWITNNVGTPNASQLTVLCMVIMVCSNLYIANKIAVVNKKLNTTEHPSVAAISSASQGNLREWPKEQLDRHMVALERMVQKAGQSMEEATKIVEEQRQRLHLEWSE
ncbi:GRAM domain-containing protein [Phycomyces blakesleeanus]|uniref:GRAM domain-containing protein n=1 Tax=Phycomyces blakesleeanus TaxID=4837 RepID=A0ABR3AZU1_PHYBL